MTSLQYLDQSEVTNVWIKDLVV